MQLSESQNKMLKIAIQALLGLVLVIPLVFFKQFFYPFVTGKVLMFRLIVEVAFVLFAASFFLNKRINFRSTVVWKVFAVVTGVILLAGIFGVNSYNSFWSNMERAEGGLFWVHLFAYLSLLIFAFRSKRDFKILFRVSLVVSLLTVVYGLMQTYEVIGAVTTSGARMSSTLGNAAYLGSYLLMNVFIALSLLVTDKNKYWQGFYGLFSVLAVIAIFMTQTRGAILGLLGGLFLVAVLSVLRSKNKQMKIAGATAVGVIIILISSIFLFSDSKIVTQNESLRRIATISFNDYTTQTRLLAWTSASKGFADRPLLGWGSENYNYAFSQYFPPEIYTDAGSRLWFDKAHSVFFEFLVTTGIVGVIAYFGLLLLVVWQLFKSKAISVLESNIFIGLLAGYTFANLFVFDTVSTYIMFALILAYTSSVVMKKTEVEDIIPSVKLTGLKSIGLIVILVFLAVTAYNINYQNIVSNKKLFTAEVSARGTDLSATYQAYLAAIEDNSNPTKFETRRAFVLFVLGAASQLPDHQASGMYDKAIESILMSISEDPEDIRHYYNLSQLYLKSSKFDPSRLNKVIDLGDKMLSLGETRAHTYYQIGEAYFRQSDYESALTAFQSAVELNPDVVETYINVYSIAVLLGNQELEQKTADNMIRLHPNYFQREDVLLRFIPLYKQAGLNDRVIVGLEQLMATYPNKIEYIVSLATVYAELGQNQKAEEVISVLLGQDAQLDIQLRDFIEKIYNGNFLKTN
jgi:O-antigen ligase/tetratricopeptide (TPR) repeat protein